MKYLLNSLLVNTQAFNYHIGHVLGKQAPELKFDQCLMPRRTGIKWRLNE